MQQTIRDARVYAEQLAELHREPRHIVMLPSASRAARAARGITGDYYGGVMPSELPDWIADGAKLIETVQPPASR